MAEELENVAPPVFVSGIELLRTFFARSAKNFFFAKKKEIGRGILKFFGKNGIFSDKYAAAPFFLFCSAKKGSLSDSVV